MNALLHALKSPDIQGGIIWRLDHAQQGIPETPIFRGVIRSRVSLMKRLRVKLYRVTVWR